MKKKDVFISYKSEEFDEAEWVRSTLENNGVSCWMAPSCIPGGSSYAVEIPQAIRNCKVFVLILSEKSQLSKWVPRELDQAINEGKIVLPFMLENCALKDDFNFYLTNVQRYAAYESKTAAFENMLVRIKAIISSYEEAEKVSVKTDELSEPVSDVSDVNKTEIKETQAKVSDVSAVKEPEVVETSATQNIQIKQNPKKEEPESGVIPDIPEILKEKPQPKKKSKKKGILAICIAAVISLVLIGVITSLLNTVEIAGNKYKKNDTTVSIYDAELSLEDIEALKKMNAVSYINFRNCTLPDTDLSWITNAATVSLENCGLTDEHLKTIDFKSLDLSSLDIDGNENVSDLSFLTDVSDTLTTVSFNTCSVSDISFADKLTNLKSFYADDNGISDISALKNCTKLQILSLNSNEINSLESLSSFTGLRELYINSNRLTTFKGLEKAIRLEIIEADNNEMNDFSGLNNITILEKFSLKNNNSTDEKVLSEILVASAKTLNELRLDGNLFEDFGFVSSLNMLNIFTVDNCKNLRSLEILNNLTLLKHFSAQDCSVVSLKGLENCQSLTYLDLSYNDISSIEYLPDFKNSNIHLNLSKNLLTDVSLREQKFSTLLLFGNTIKTLDIAEVSGGEIIVGYCDGFDYGTIAENFYSYILIDIPLNKQVLISNEIVTAEFLTEEEYINSLAK